MSSFVTIDVETANPNFASICQVGICCVRDGVITDEWESLINPEDYFAPMNISVHSIEEHHVKGAPKLPEIYDELCARLDNSIVVSHSKFDRTALNQAYGKYSLKAHRSTWLDSIDLAKQAWPNLQNWKLTSIASHVGLQFKHHDALEDARVAAKITLRACEQTQRRIENW